MVKREVLLHSLPSVFDLLYNRSFRATFDKYAKSVNSRFDRELYKKCYDMFLAFSSYLILVKDYSKTSVHEDQNITDKVLDVLDELTGVLDAGLNRTIRYLLNELTTIKSSNKRKSASKDQLFRTKQGGLNKHSDSDSSSDSSSDGTNKNSETTKKAASDDSNSNSQSRTEPNKRKEVKRIQIDRRSLRPNLNKPILRHTSSRTPKLN